MIVYQLHVKCRKYLPFGVSSSQKQGSNLCQFSSKSFMHGASSPVILPMCNCNSHRILKQKLCSFTNVTLDILCSRLEAEVSATSDLANQLKTSSLILSGAGGFYLLEFLAENLSTYKFTWKKGMQLTNIREITNKWF